MIVLDASVVVELLLRQRLASAIRAELTRLDQTLIVPHLLDLEVVSALRRMAVAGRQIDRHQSGRLLESLARLPAERYPHTPFLNRIWELRHSFTLYDAVYIAMAEATDAVLFTCDRKLSRGHQAAVQVFA